MKEFFASLYEQPFFEGRYQLIYNALFDTQGYISFWAIFLIIPLVVVAIFYFERWLPYLKAWHWVLAVIIGLIIVFTSTVSVFNVTIFASGNQQLANYLASPDSGYYEHARTMRYIFGMYNVFLATIAAMIYSAVFKRFSKLHSHLPL